MTYLQEDWIGFQFLPYALNAETQAERKQNERVSILTLQQKSKTILPLNGKT